MAQATEKLSQERLMKAKASKNSLAIVRPKRLREEKDKGTFSG